jgi:hypothetical protein
MLLRLFTTLLLLFAVVLGCKHGWAMVQGKPEMLQLFGQWNFSKRAALFNGSITLLASFLLIFPRTYFLGNFLMATGILLILAFHLSDQNWKGALIELPFLAINLLLIYLQHPLKR